MSACWSGPVGAAGLGFDGAWRRDGRVTRRVTYTQFSHYLGDPGTEPAPGKAGEATAAKEQEEMLTAMSTCLDDGSSFVRTHAGETCGFHVVQPPPFGRQRCTNPVQDGYPYCSGPCVRE